MFSCVKNGTNVSNEYQTTCSQNVVVACEPEDISELGEKVSGIETFDKYF